MAGTVVSFCAVLFPCAVPVQEREMDINKSMNARTTNPD